MNNQAPSTKNRAFDLKLGAWNFSGAWMLDAWSFYN
jgi:hypothetical protein